VTRDELLALFPDNTSGDISAADLRSAVGELYDAAHTATQAYAYRWSTASPPGAGRVTMTWALGVQTLHLSETSDDGLAFPFGLSGSAAVIVLSTAAGQKLILSVTGAASDFGTYRDVPANVTQVTGTVPANNDAVTVSLAVRQ